jgi:hypothetical protein
MDWIFAILLFLHVAGAVLAFGPTYTFAFIGSMGGAEREHLNFALRLQHRLVTTLVLPLAVVQGVTGLLLVWRIGFDVLMRGWLILGIALYLVALGIGFFVSLPALRILLPATAATPPAAHPAAAAPAGASVSAGPPPFVVAARKRAQMGGMINGVLIMVIIFLMVTRPF